MKVIPYSLKEGISACGNDLEDIIFLLVTKDGSSQSLRESHRSCRRHEHKRPICPLEARGPHAVYSFSLAVHYVVQDKTSHALVALEGI